MGALWLVMLVSALGAPGDPGEAAIRFLEKTRARQLDLEPGGDTALSPQTSAAKRREIARRLQRLADDLGSDPLEASAVKLDGNMAGVLIRKDDGFDPASQRVFAIAMVKRCDAWVAAPVPASFENTGLGYSGDLRQRAAALENWMLRQQVLDLAILHDQSAERLRHSIEKSLPAETLRKLDSKQAAARFLDACAHRNLPEILGLIGGLAASPPEDWPARLKAATAAARLPEPKRPWGLMVSNNVLRVPVHHEEDAGQALVSVACLDPVGGNRPVTPRVELVHLEISKSTDGLWRVDPPARFFQEPSENEEPQDDSLDADLLAAFTEKLADVYPPAPEPTARQASEKLLERLQTGDFPSLARFIQPGGNSAEPCIRAARIWWAMREPSGIRRLIPLGFKEDARTAAAVCQLFSTRSPDRLDLRIFHFEKSTDGWLWTPQPKPETEAALRDWANAESSGWQDDLLADCVELQNLPETGAPSEAEARAMVESWIKATAAGDVAAALRLTARLNMPKSETTVLRNLGYEMSGIRKNNEPPPSITGVQHGGIWTAVGVRSAAEDKPAHPLYPVVSTPAGPRILIEIDLIASQNRTRDFLNRTALDRLRHLPKAAAELKELLQKHQAGVTEATAP